MLASLNRLRLWAPARDARALLTLAVCACADPRSTHPVAAAPALAGVTFDANGVPGPLPDDFLVTYDQTGCFGWCPDFEVTIDRDGAGTFTGRSCVQQPGPSPTWVAPDDLRDVVATLGALRFGELDERYDALEPWFGWASDSPTATMTVRSGGVETTVADYWGNDGVLLPRVPGPMRAATYLPLPEWLEQLRDLDSYVYDITGVERSIGDPFLVDGCGI